MYMPNEIRVERTKDGRWFSMFCEQMPLKKIYSYAVFADRNLTRIEAQKQFADDINKDIAWCEKHRKGLSLFVHKNYFNKVR